MIKNKKYVYLTLLLSLFFIGVFQVKADMNAYRLYNPTDGQHLWTTSGNEKYSLMNAGWKSEGVSWAFASSGTTSIWRLSDKSGNHFYTDNLTEVSIVERQGYRMEGIFGYSSGNIPVYRLMNRAGNRMWTTSSSEINGLKKIGYHLEGLAFYSIAPKYSWSYDVSQSNYAGQPNDIHFPQFDYLISTEGQATPYQGNSIFSAYNDAVFNFNVQLQADSKSADYADAQARKDWLNKQNLETLAVSNAKFALDTATTKMNEAQTLVNQAQSYLTADTQHNLDSTKDQALLTEYQANLTTANSVYNADNTTYQNAVTELNTLNNQGTDYVSLSYTINLTNGGKTVHVNFTKTSYTAGVTTTSTFTRSATLVAV